MEARNTTIVRTSVVRKDAIFPALIGSLSEAVGPPFLEGTMLPLAIAMASDPVPNVRFNVARTLRKLMPLFDSATVQSKLRSCLSTLSEDKDPDVSYFAAQALRD